MERELMGHTEYIKPKNLNDLLYNMKETEGRGEVIAGGTNLIPQMKEKIKSPEFLIDVCDLQELSQIKEENGIISIGAGTTIADIASSDIIKRKGQILASAARQLGNPLVRNRATIGGNLADASPAADTAPALLALEAFLYLESEAGGKREVPLDQFFTDPNQTVMKENEVITRICFKEPECPLNGGYIKLGLRNAMAISVVSVAVMLDVEEGICRKARIALGSVAPKPVRAYGVEKMLEGKELILEVIEASAHAVKEDISPISDIRASAEYRQHTASVLLKRAILEARDRGNK
jgi:CO/xanthine dehydrogenase FAD-binding subunit